MIRYIAVDPGVVSGIAVVDVHPTGKMVHRVREIDSLPKLRLMVRRLTRPDNELVIVSEKFVISQRTIRGKVFYESLYFNGWLTLEYPDAVLQPLSYKNGPIRKQVYSLGWGVPTKDDHADDATCHALARMKMDKVPAVLAAMRGLAK